MLTSFVFFRWPILWLEILTELENIMWCDHHREFHMIGILYIYFYAIRVFVSNISETTVYYTITKVSSKKQQHTFYCT